MENKKIIDLIEKNDGIISLRTLSVIYRLLLIKTGVPTLKDVSFFYDYLMEKTKDMKKTNKEIKEMVKPFLWV